MNRHERRKRVKEVRQRIIRRRRRWWGKGTPKLARPRRRVVPSMPSPLTPAEKVRLEQRKARPNSRKKRRARHVEELVRRRVEQGWSEDAARGRWRAELEEFAKGE